MDATMNVIAEFINGLLYGSDLICYYLEPVDIGFIENKSILCEFAIFDGFVNFCGRNAKEDNFKLELADPEFFNNLRVHINTIRSHYDRYQ